jgi:hypothetical protein
MPAASPSVRRHALVAGALGVALVATAAASQTAPAQPQPITRENLLRNDLGTPGREAIQVRVGSRRAPSLHGTAIRARSWSMCSAARSITGWRAGRR